MAKIKLFAWIKSQSTRLIRITYWRNKFLNQKQKNPPVSQSPSLLNLSLFTLTVVIILLSTPIIAQSNGESQQQELTISPTTPRPQKSIWQAIWELFKRQPEPSLASRDSICLITPGLLESLNTIWSDRPMLIWQGEVSPTTIYLYDSFNPDREQQLLWSQTFTPQSSASKFHHFLYTGESLQPGKSYDLEIIIPNSDPEQSLSYDRQRHTFQVMASEERARITTELIALENQLAAKEVSEEEIALKKANYFAQQGLWSDALQQIYSTPNPSADFLTNAQGILSALCED